MKPTVDTLGVFRLGWRVLTGIGSVGSFGGRTVEMTSGADSERGTYFVGVPLWTSGLGFRSRALLIWSVGDPGFVPLIHCSETSPVGSSFILLIEVARWLS